MFLQLTSSGLPGTVQLFRIPMAAQDWHIN
jgi:hypothetical protein